MNFETKKEDFFVPNDHFEFSNIIYRKLLAQNISIDNLESISSEQDRKILIKNIAEYPEKYADAIGLTYVKTDGFHDVANGNQPLGDVFFSDMISGLFNLKTKKRILDFGCSTGRVIRNLSFAYPHLEAFGCDPRETSIEFIKAIAPKVKWFVNNSVPPIAIHALPRFDMVFAISIWSHFSEERALEWFDEMHKILNKNGKLIFTAHGFRSVYHFTDVLNKMPREMAENRLEALRNGEMHFQPYPEDNKSFLGPHWGMAFIPPDWVQEKLKSSWEIQGFYPGLAMGNQDTYVLRRRAKFFRRFSIKLN